jgi:hypothetical protein
MPYYKWSFRALGASERFSSLCEELEYLISSFNTEEESKKKLDIIENVCQTIVRVLLEQKLSTDTSRELEAHAYSVNATIRDPQIRNQHIFYGV